MSLIQKLKKEMQSHKHKKSRQKRRKDNLDIDMKNCVTQPKKIPRTGIRSPLQCLNDRNLSIRDQLLKKTLEESLIFCPDNVLTNIFILIKFNNQLSSVLRKNKKECKACQCFDESWTFSEGGFDLCGSCNQFVLDCFRIYWKKREGIEYESDSDVELEPELR